MKITKNAPPPKPAPSFTLACSKEELKYLKYVVAQTLVGDDEEADVEKGTSGAVWSALNKLVLS